MGGYGQVVGAAEWVWQGSPGAGALTDLAARGGMTGCARGARPQAVPLTSGE